MDKSIQFNKLEGTELYDGLMEGHDWGFKVFRNLLDVNLTALDVADAYYFAKKKGYLTKDDKANKDPKDKSNEKENVVDADFEDVKEDKEKSA